MFLNPTCIFLRHIQQNKFISKFCRDWHLLVIKNGGFLWRWGIPLPYCQELNPWLPFNINHISITGNSQVLNISSFLTAQHKEPLLGGCFTAWAKEGSRRSSTRSTLPVLESSSRESTQAHPHYTKKMFSETLLFCLSCTANMHTCHQRIYTYYVFLVLYV